MCVRFTFNALQAKVTIGTLAVLSGLGYINGTVTNIFNLTSKPQKMRQRRAEPGPMLNRQRWGIMHRIGILKIWPLK